MTSEVLSPRNPTPHTQRKAEHTKPDTRDTHATHATHTARMADFQLSLGDPAGQANAEYWDAWFNSVSNGSRFEWYVSSSAAIASLLEVSLFGPGSPPLSQWSQDCTSLSSSTRVLHGGSGNSELIFDLAASHNMTDAVALDISPVAVDEMTLKVSLRSALEPCLGSLSFVLHDVLTPLPFPSSTFDAFLDKGLFDAMMSSADDPYKSNASLLFSHVHAVLKPERPYVCVTLAESHVVRLFHSAATATSTKHAAGWGPLNIFELKPDDDNKSSLRPFAFVLHRAAADSCHVGTVNFFDLAEDDGSSSSSSPSPSWSSSPSYSASFPTFAAVDEVVIASRAAYDSSVKARRKGKTAVSAAISLSLLTFDVKPYECECDLLSLYARLSSSEGPLGGAAFEPPIVWREHAIVPIGFGVSKLVITCVLNSDDVDNVVDVIQDEEQDEVQSVDIVSCMQVATDLAAVFKDKVKLGR